MLVGTLGHLGKIGVLYGGVTAERDVSLKSGGAVMAACKNLGLDVVGVDLQYDVIEKIKTSDIDTAFIALHGGIGEDGRLQALLDFMGIAYTGSGVQASILAMNKLVSKQIWQSMGLPTSPFIALDTQTNYQAVIDSLGAVMVKPAHEGSSIGMAIANTSKELEVAYRKAVEFDACVFAEGLLPGPEYTVSIVGDEILPPIKLETSHSFYDYEAKYIANDTRYICPCGLSEEKENELKILSKKAFDSLHCNAWGRVDLMIDQKGDFNVLEVNTVPGMTSHSLVPMAADVAGYSFDGLIEKILQTVAR